MSDLTVKINTTRSTDGIVLMATLGSGITIAPSFGANTPTLLSTLTDNSFTIPTGFSGRIYFFLTDKVSDVPTSPSEISTTLGLRYDWIEATCDGSKTACANLTSVDQFGIALSLETKDSSGNKIGTVGYNISAKDLVADLGALAPSAVVGDMSQGTFTRVISPLHTPAGTYGSLKDYIKLIDGKTIYLTGTYNGSTDANHVYHPAASFFYRCAFDSTKTDIELIPEADSGIQGTIKIPSSSLEDMIYACDGKFDVPGTTAGKNGNGVGDTVGFNDDWSTVVRNFLVGWNLGFYGYKPAPVDGYQYDCDNSWDWMPQFSFKMTDSENSLCYNNYAETIWNNSNSYGFPFSDFLGKPLLNLYEVPTLEISVLKDDETNTAYTPPTPQSITPVDHKNPQSGNSTDHSIIFNAGVGDSIYYTGTVEFDSKFFEFGYVTQFTATTPGATTANGNCTIANVPANVSSVNQYTFKFMGKPFNLYLKLDSDGKILEAVVDGNLTVTPDNTGYNVTISGIMDHISPAVAV